MKWAIVLFSFLFLLGAGTVAYSTYSAHRQRKSHAAEMCALLVSIDRAETRTRFAGIRTTTFEWAGSAYVTTLRLHVEGDRRKVEVVSSDSRGGHRQKMAYLGGLPSSLRPGYGTRGRFHDPDLVLRNYDVRMDGTREVADRQGDVLRIVSRHPGRPSYVVVADRATRFPLAFEVRNDAGTRIFATRFEAIEFPAAFPEDTFPSRTPTRPSWIRVTEESASVDALPSDLGFPVWIPRDPPQGFQPMGARCLRIATTRPILFNKTIDVRVLHTAYTDGMALFWTVQLSRDNEVWKLIRSWLPETKSSGGILARKFTCATGTALLIEMDETVILLAGNISSGELEAAARSLVRRRT